MSCRNQKVNAWVKEVVARLKPDTVVWVNGSDDEARKINNHLVEQGIFTPLNEKEYPNSFWSVSHPNDVARVEENFHLFPCTR